jgi:IS30 family transposase
MFRRQREAILERDVELKRFVLDRLSENRTPEQISGWLKRGLEIGLTGVSIETIYAFGAMLEPMAHAPLTLSERSES